MTQTRVTLEVVRQAKNALVDRGIRPGVTAVRNEIGYGSNSTIQKHLETLGREAQGLLGELGVVSEALATLVLQLHNQLQSEAQAVIAKAQGEAAERLQVEVAEKDLAIKKAAALEEERLALETKLVAADRYSEEITGKFHEANREIAALKTTVAATNDALKDRDTRLGKAEHDLAATRDAMTHYQNSVSEIRQKELAVHDREITTFQARTSELEGRIILLNEQTHDLNRSNAGLQAEITHLTKTKTAAETATEAALVTVDRLEAQVDNLRIDMAGTKGQMQMLERQQAESAAALKEVTHERDDTRRTADDLAGQVKRLQAALELANAKTAPPAAGTTEPNPGAADPLPESREEP